MPKYRVTVVFDRKNVKGKLEKSERQGEFYAPSAAVAKVNYLKIFKGNEPDRRKIHKVTVEKIGD